MKINNKHDDIINAARAEFLELVKSESPRYYECIDRVTAKLIEQNPNLTQIDAGSLARQALVKMLATGAVVASSQEEGNDRAKLFLNHPDRITGTQL